MCKNLFSYISCFLKFYTFLLIFSIPLTFIIIWRLLVAILFKLCYGNRFQLADVTTGLYCYEKYANVFNINFFMYIDGPLDIELLRERINQKFTSFKDKDGSKPYERMLCSLERKFGFFCWRNRRTTFDISHHIRFLPGCSDPEQIYSEDEVLATTAELGVEPWPVSKPRWEYLVIPRLRKKDTGEICSGIHLRQQHAYGDGVSLAQIIRLCVADDKTQSKFNFDPVNPKGMEKLSFWRKLGAFIQVFFLGPWALLKHGGRQDEHVFLEGPLKGGRIYARTTMEINTGMMRELRTFYKCTTNALQHFLVTETLRRFALKKSLQLPEEMMGGIVHAKMPYPNEYPQNRAMIFVEPFPVGEKWERDKEGRLWEVNKICGITSPFKNYYVVLALRFFVKFIGVLPASFISKIFEGFVFSYAISNVPGIKDAIYLDGKKVVNVFGFGPLVTGNRYFIGVGCYEDKFTFGFTTEISKLIQGPNEMDEFIAEFENQVKLLLENVTV